MSHSCSCASYSSEIRLNGQINQKLHWLNQKINYRDYTTMKVNKRLPMNGRLNGRTVNRCQPYWDDWVVLCCMHAIPDIYATHLAHPGSILLMRLSRNSQGKDDVASLVSSLRTNSFNPWCPRSQFDTKLGRRF